MQIGNLTDERDLLRKQYIELRKKLEQRKILDMKIGEFNERKAAIERGEATRNELRRELLESKQKLEKHLFSLVQSLGNNALAAFTRPNQKNCRRHS